MTDIHYRRLRADGWRSRLRGWKYQLTDPYIVQTDLHPGRVGTVVHNGWISLAHDGWLTIERHYAWDGPSGPTIDTPTFMRGSLIHDALYQLQRESRLSREWRKAADLELRRACLADGMSAIRAWWVYWGVRLFAGYAAKG